MTQRWYMLHEGKEIGPFTADELRLGIRRGEVDPFDVAYQEGSQVRRVLIDIDEVFESSGAVYQIAEAEPLAFPSRTNAEPTRISRPISDASRIKAERSDASRVAQEFREATREDKKYFVYVRGKRVLGPLRPRSIAAAFQSGQLNRWAKIAKEGASSRIKIKDFIQRYEGSRGVAPPARHVPGAVSKKGSLTRFKGPAEPVIPGALPLVSLLAVLAGIVICYVAIRSLGIDRVLGTAMRRGEAKIARMVHDEEDKEPRASSREALEPTSVPQPLPTVPPLPTPAPERVEKPSPKPTVAAKLPPIKSEKRNTRVVDKSKRREPPREFRDEPPPFRAFEPPANFNFTPQQRINSPPPAPLSPARSVNGLSAQIGRVVTLSQMNYSVAALQQCAMKCKLSFSGAQGQVTGVFFKGAFEGRLRASNGTATIRGLLKQEGGQLLLYLQQ